MVSTLFRHSRIVFDQSDSLLWLRDQLGRWGESGRSCVPRLQQSFWHCLP